MEANTTPTSNYPDKEPETTVSATPAAEPAPTMQPTPAPVAPSASAGHVILQWLTYAFWSWTLIGLSWMTFIVFFHFIDGSATVVDMIPYAIASVFVLAPVSVICDLLYIKREPVEKTGVTKAIMLVHAILFALFSVGVLIGTVFAFVQLLVSDGSSTSTMATMYSLLVVSILTIATFIRTLNPRANRLVPRIYVGFMALASVIFIILSFAGPVARAQQLKNDRLIESHLSTVKSDIDSYVEANKKLPASLADVTVDGSAKQLIDKNLVEYKNEGEVKDSPAVNNGKKYSTYSYTDSTRTFRYQLCVTYQAKSTSDYSSYESARSSNADSGYDTYVSTYAHPAGNTCYKLEKQLYSYNSGVDIGN